MKVKDMKDILKLYADDTDFVIKGASGIEYEIDSILLTNHLKKDEKREVCKINIK